MTGARHVGLPAGSPLLLGGVLMARPTGLLLGLRPAWEAAEFDPGRVGLNHLSFEVATEEALHALATGLARFGCRGTAPSRVEIAEIAGLRTTDPSGIPVSLIAQLGPALSVWWCVLRSCDLQVPPHDLAVFFSYLLHERAPVWWLGFRLPRSTGSAAVTSRPTATAKAAAQGRLSRLHSPHSPKQVNFGRDHHMATLAF